MKFNHGIKGSLAIGGQCGLFHFLSGQHSYRGFGVISKLVNFILPFKTELSLKPKNMQRGLYISFA